MFVFINYFFIHLSCRWGGTKRQREDDLEKRQIRWIYKADFNLIRHSFGCLFLFLQKEKEEIFLKEKTEKKESNQSKWNEKNVKGRRKNTTWKVEIFLTVYIPFIFLKWNLFFHSYLNFFTYFSNPIFSLIRSLTANFETSSAPSFDRCVSSPFPFGY